MATLRAMRRCGGTAFLWVNASGAPTSYIAVFAVPPTAPLPACTASLLHMTFREIRLTILSPGSLGLSPRSSAPPLSLLRTSLKLLRRAFLPPKSSFIILSPAGEARLKSHTHNSALGMREIG